MACFEKLRAERDFLKSLSPSLDSLDVGTETYVARVREKDLENQLIAERCELEAGAAGRHVRASCSPCGWTADHLFDQPDAPRRWARRPSSATSSTFRR